MSLFEAAGFEVTLLRKLSFVDPAYLDDVLKRVQPQFKAMDGDALQVLGGLFRIRKPIAETCPEDVVPLEIADSPIAGVSRNDP